MAERVTPGAMAVALRGQEKASFSGCPPNKRTIADLQAAATRRLRRQRQVEVIHGFGARVVYELVDELDRHHKLGADLDRRLARYAALNFEVLRALGVDKFPAAPIRALESGR